MRIRTYAFDTFEVDLSLYQLRQGTDVVDLGARNFDVLVHLVRHRSRFVSREELIRDVWGVAVMSESSVPTAINAVRRALGDDPAAPRFIETLRGRGYRFIAPVCERGEGGLPAQVEAADTSEPPETIFVGREAELRALYAGFEQALAHTPRLMLVVGEPGIGKTRLLEQFAPWVRQDGATVLFGRCLESEGAPAFWPWTQIVRSYVDDIGVRGMPRALEPVAPVIAQMIPELSERFPELPEPHPLEPEQARFRLLDSVTAFLRRAAEERPLVLLFDDLHRADTSSLSLLQFAVHELGDAPILVVGTYREADVHRDPERLDLVSALAREEPARSIALPPLTRDDVTAYLTERSAGTTPPPRLAATLHEQSGGNPFFLTQLADLFAHDGKIANPSGAPIAPIRLPLPAGIREAIIRQLDGLPAPTRKALEGAAIIGRDFAASLLAKALRLRPSVLLEQLQPALDARLLISVPTSSDHYRFVHLLVRSALYDSLAERDRKHLHHAIARLQERAHHGNLQPHAAEIAHHFLHAVPLASHKKAVEFSRLAALCAASRFAYEDAAQCCRTALTTLATSADTDPDERYSLLLLLGRFELRSGQRTTAEATLHQAAAVARSLGRPDLLAQAALELSPGLLSLEVGAYDHALLSLLREALLDLPETDTDLRSKLLARLAMALLRSHTIADAVTTSTEALQLARQSQNPESLFSALVAHHGTLWLPEDYPQRLQTIRQLRELLRLRAKAEDLILCRLLQITSALEEGNLAVLESEIASFSQLAQDLKQPRFEWYVDLFRAMRALMCGKFSEARAASHRFHTLGRKARDSNADQSFAAHFALLRWETGHNDAAHLAEQFAASHPTIPAWKCAVAFLHVNANNTAAARHYYADLASRGFADLLPNETRQVGLLLAAETCFDLDDTTSAATLYEKLKPYNGRFGVLGYAVAFFGSVSTQLGMLATLLRNWEDAEEHFEHALAGNQRLGAIPWQARTHFRFAQMLIAKSDTADRDRIEHHLAACSALCHELGMTRLLERAGDLLSGKR